MENIKFRVKNVIFSEGQESRAVFTLTMVTCTDHSVMK